ncbi:MAG: ABC transporter permease subunit [Acidimicrobiia bacterium]|nr:ABC transporter permease subunit [Acidimicrobiia bacterium]
MRTRTVVAAGVVGIVVFGVLWELLVRVLDVKAFILLPPSRIVAEFLERPAFYAEAAAVTARHAGIGLVIAVVVAILAGALLAASRLLEHAVQPVLMLILVAPWVAYFTSIVVWLGRGDAPVIFLVTLVTVPAFTFATVAGLRSADPAARELLATVDASRIEVLWRLRLPSALPAILATARYGAALALAAAYYGEGGNLVDAGLGAAGRRAANAQNGPVLWATVVSSVLLGVAFLTLIALAERTLLRWHVSQRRDARPHLRPPGAGSLR